MPPLEVIAIVVAGIAAGTINAIVGSGTLVTFPTLLFFGYPPLTANISNTIGLVAGGASGAWAYRPEMVGGSATLRRLAPLSLIGSVVGATVLLVLPPAAFEAIVPVLVAVSLVLVVAGPRINARAARHEVDHSGLPLQAGVFAAGVYGGYFGAAQGVLLVGLFSALTSEPLQRLTGYKNVLSTIVNLVAAVVFLLVARDHVDWMATALIAVGATAGGLIGARIGRRLPAAALRALIVTVGLAAIAKMVLS